MYFSIIIPVFNRPDEIKELLDSLVQTDYKEDFELVIIEDGSNLTCENVIDSFKSKLNISYYIKENTGPGDSRNYGMKKAKGDYFLIFDYMVLCNHQRNVFLFFQQLLISIYLIVR